MINTPNQSSKKEQNLFFFNRWARSYDWAIFQFWMRRFHRPVFEQITSGCVKINRPREMRSLFEQAGLGNIQQQRSFLFGVMTRGEKIL